MAIRRDIHDQRRRDNTWQTIAITLGLGLILAFCGWMIGGFFGLVLALCLVVLTVLVTPRIAPHLIFPLLQGPVAHTRNQSRVSTESWSL